MTKQESANEYKKYIDEHITNIKKAFNEYAPILCGLLVIYDGNYTSKEDVHNDPDINDVINQLYMQLTKQVQHHDSSKYNIEEFDLYRHKFYKADGEEELSDYEFNKAWLHHIHNNPHHPEYYIYTDYDNHYETMVYEMPNRYIAEMILDWIAMSYKFNDKVYNYWKKEGGHKALIMHDNVVKKVDFIMEKLERMDKKFEK